MPTSERELWQRWIDKRAEICLRLGAERCSVPFVSVEPPNYKPQSRASVLYVGKATRGLWGDQRDFGGPLVGDVNLTPEKLVKYTIEWLTKKILDRGWRQPSAFWHFARSLSARIAITQCASLENLVWTNICKIGIDSGNPSREYLALQRELAVETLTFEIKLYKPKLVFWVTGDYASDVIGNVVDDGAQKTWHKEASDLGFWWRQPIAAMPAMIWAYHPQGKTREVMEAWRHKAAELAA